jgi:hypothetical protein
MVSPSAAQSHRLMTADELLAHADPRIGFLVGDAVFIERYSMAFSHHSALSTTRLSITGLLLP